ncbi:8337_t:CDS:2 [Ambispora gerdemannii]|uniref:8337_t:CDS:1 n=1 Tax=Ambispora gerdemannii TaxID=144530 RepID=A0A9N9AW13_9GLOM|nr:8337_t:CDS:2 [Ambispora gerdemannii]
MIIPFPNEVWINIVKQYFKISGLRETWLLRGISHDFQSFVVSAIYEEFKENFECFVKIFRWKKDVELCSRTFEYTNVSLLQPSTTSQNINNELYVILKPTHHTGKLIEEEETLLTQIRVHIYLYSEFTNGYGKTYISGKNLVLDSRIKYPRRMAFSFSNENNHVDVAPVDKAVVPVAESAEERKEFFEECNLCEIRIPLLMTFSSVACRLNFHF